MNIILFGYRGSGKSTIGKLLAAELWKTFQDVDRQACQRFNNPSIADIWAQHGEPEWRRVEVEVTRELLAGDEQVIALGGGTLMQPEAREAVAQASSAKRIYLRCAPEELLRRIESDTQSAATRPSLTTHGGNIAEIEHVLAERGPVYEAVADHVLDVTRLEPKPAVRYLISRCL